MKTSEARERIAEASLNAYELLDPIWEHDTADLSDQEAGWLDAAMDTLKMFAGCAELRRHLCLECKKEFATCASDPQFGDGPEYDNVFMCNGFDRQLWRDGHLIANDER